MSMLVAPSSTEVADLSEETKLPRELVSRFSEMWAAHEPPFFTAVSEETGTMALDDLAEVRARSHTSRDRPRRLSHRTPSTR